ncbi:solute carrier organic anion transporter family member 74D [Anthonomus grandis grandis]|uniref:solute carrier organic anion transporter family member 74D n=1 Tax=Anthonomus grandis grandis TaxID=2921223 RepID=UPI002165B8E1|nr:solute carrier organic anion transporter family member 74D [Anthonomus grandis grandis]
MSIEKYDTKMSKVSNNNSASLEEMCPLQNGSKHNEAAGEKSSLTEADEHYEPNHISRNHISNDDVGAQSDTDDDESETRCGWGPCSPSWCKMFASKQVFLAVFCMAWVLQGMYHTYFVSAITTIEKLFQIQSKVTGIIMSATEIGQIGSSLLLTYYGGQGHRPKWIAWGVVLFGVSSFTCSLPHFIYGRQLINANDPTGIIRHPNVCKSPNYELDELFLRSSIKQNASDFINENMSPIIQSCSESDVIPGHQIQSSVTNIVLAIFFVSLLGVGMGQTAVYTLGIPFMDDNVSSKQSPLYFAITIGVRILGPAFGFIVGSLCTSVYADLSVDPKIDSSDPRWVGAWWLGLVIISVLLLLAAIAMFAFPKRLPHVKSFHNRPKTNKMLVNKKQPPTLRDFPKTVKRLLKNDILMFRTASSVLHILPIAGLYTFLPKYLESQFRLPTPTANMISGVGGILVMGVGIVISGIFILKVKPNARFVAGWIAFTAIVYAMGMCVLMFIGCPMNEFAELKTNDGLIQLSSCNKTLCNCNEDQFEPICGEDGKTYLSPCHAGCQNVTEKDGKITGYVSCMCIDSIEGSIDDNTTIYGNATIGYCDQECGNFMLYIVLFSIFVFVHSTSEVGSMLLILRCVDPKDKAMALGLIQFAIGLFGNVPCPIIYGAVVDSACRIWKMACGEQGACGLYDADMFRMFYHGITGALLLCAFFVDLTVWYKAGSINFVEEPPQFEEELATIDIKIKEDSE